MSTAETSENLQARSVTPATAKPRATETLILKAGDDAADLRERLSSALSAEDAARRQILVACHERARAAVADMLASDASMRASGSAPLKLISLPPSPAHASAASLLDEIHTEQVAFLRAGAQFTPPPWADLKSHAPALMAWSQPVPTPAHTALESLPHVNGWLATTTLLRQLCAAGTAHEARGWRLLDIAQAARRADLKFTWLSPRLVTFDDPSAPPASATHTLDLQSTVAALIPHYQCEEWLDECLESLLEQTHPLNAIVVIDDHSPRPPIELVQKFPRVTLLRATENGGPYRLVQEVINRTGYDAYLFQDADDWSAHDRLATLLAEAERTGAELIGSQELHVLCDEGEVAPLCYPLDVSAAYARRAGHPILHPTTLLARSLVQRVGGFPTALRFGGDSEFLSRVGYIARIVNVPRYCYFHRHRTGSLTTATATAIGSEARNELMLRLRLWREENKDAIRRGAARPFAVAPPVGLEHLCGPELLPAPA